MVEPSGLVEQIALAIKEADEAFGFSPNLTRLVDGVATYTLRISGADPTEHDGTADAYDRVVVERNRQRAAAILAVPALQASLARERELEAENARLVGALKLSAERFREYERLHAAKLRPDLSPFEREDIGAKVQRNREMAETCEAALSTPEASSVTEARD